MTTTSTQSKTDGQLYAAIQDGIRLSGMPYWGEPRDDDGSTWALVAFIRYLPQLSPEDLREMTRMNPRSPTEAGEVEEDDAFLRGGAPSQHHGSH